MSDNNTSRFKVRIPRIKTSNQTYDFSLSLPGMISAVGVGVLALAFFFVMGILIGRGYRPESDVPRLGEIMPSQQQGNMIEEPLKPEVLTAEELDYPQRLKAPPFKIMDVPPVEESDKPKAEVVEKTAKPADSGPKKPEVSQSAPALPGEQVFDYIYQVASFRQSERAESLSAKLVESGLRTSIERGQAKGSTWYRVQVLHHGTAASTAQMKAVLAKQGIQKPLLKKKTSSR